MRALVVEDTPALRVALVQALADDGWAVDSAASGTEGLWHAEGTDYDAIVLDLGLPGMEGMEVLRRMRAAGRESPVLVLTARAAVEDRVAGLDAGADDYLAKPFSNAELLARLRSLARRRAATRSPIVRVADLALDTTARRVTRGGAPIELSPREYALLAYLASRRGEVVSRTEAWEHVYDHLAEAQSNVVDVYVGHLRRKLEAGGGPRLLHTRRGHGYVLGEAEVAGDSG